LLVTAGKCGVGCDYHELLQILRCPRGRHHHFCRLQTTGQGQPELSADCQSRALVAHNRPSAAQFANGDAIGPRPTVTSASPLGKSLPSLVRSKGLEGTNSLHRRVASVERKTMMQRTAVNPWDWSLKLGYNQAEVIEGPARHVICAGQAAVDATGNPITRAARWAWRSTIWRRFLPRQA